MNDIRVGVNLPSCGSDPNRMDEWLRAFAADGFDCVEISLETFPLIIGGEVRREYVDVVRSVLARHRLTYSAHVSLGVDLRDTPKFDLQKRTLFASIEACRALGANPLVLHYELASRDAEVEQRFLEAHREAADLAARLGIDLCIENIEVELLEPVVRFVREVDRPNVRMNFDTGHAFLAVPVFPRRFPRVAADGAPRARARASQRQHRASSRSCASPTGRGTTISPWATGAPSAGGTSTCRPSGARSPSRRSSPS